MRVAKGFHIKITQVGYLFIALCLAVGVSALNTGNNLLYLIFSMMLSFLVLSGLLSNSTLKRVALHPVFPQRIFAHQPVSVRLHLENQKKRFPSYALLLSTAANSPQTQSRPFIIKLPAQTRTSTIDHIEFLHRGEQGLPGYWLESSYPFGLIRKTKEIPSLEQTIVFPKLVDVTKPFQFDRRHFGDFLSGQSGGSANPFGIRDYVPDDSARLIHWKSSAKTGELKVKEFEKEKKRKILLDVRLQSARDSEPLWLEKAISAAASLLLLLADHGYETTLRLNGEIVRAQGRSYLDAYLAALALATPPSDPPRTSYAREEDRLLIVTDEVGLVSSEKAVLVWGRKELADL